MVNIYYHNMDPVGLNATSTTRYSRLMLKEQALLRRVFEDQIFPVGVLFSGW